MGSPLIVFTDKVMRMIKSAVYLAMRVGCRPGATTTDISHFLASFGAKDKTLYHEGVIERVLFDLQTDGKVTSSGARWYVVGVPG
ncbi:MAG: hypothetical protein V7709_08825 [Halioglobus sp.]